MGINNKYLRREYVSKIWAIACLLKIFLGLTFILANLEIQAQEPCKGKYVQLARELYPLRPDDQWVFLNFLKQVELHRYKTPLKGNNFPYGANFDLSRTPFVFAYNSTKTKTDLMFFGWKFGAVKGLKKNEKVSKLLGMPVFTFEGMDIEKISSQEEGDNELGFFSYFAPASLKYPVELSEEDKKRIFMPHRKYLDYKHPLRIAMGANMVSIFNPNIADLVKKIKKEKKPLKKSESLGSPKEIVLHVLVHETYHIVEANLQVEAEMYKSPKKDFSYDEIKAKPELARLMYVYLETTKSAYRHQLENKDAEFKKSLSQIHSIMERIKTTSPSFWQHTTYGEYSEGFAEFATFQTFLDSGIYSPKKVWKLLNGGNSNPFYYQTGNVGGLTSRLVKLKIDWKEVHKKKYSIWEVIWDKYKKTLNELNESELDEFINKMTKNKESEIEELTKKIK